MIATPRIQRRYDRRLQAIVKSAGSIEIALEHGIPRSTTRGWLRYHGPPSVVSTDVVDQDTIDLQLEVLALRRKVKRLTAFIRLMFAVFKLSQFSFAKFRVQESKDKLRLLSAIDQCRRKMQRGQASLLEGKWICWRLRGRMVDSRLSRLAMDSTQSGSPSGLPRWAESRTAANSGSDSGVLTRSTQPGSLGIGQGESSGGCSAGL